MRQCDLSILIPARNEEFLARTIQDALENIEADTEIIATLDGQWIEPGVPQHDRVNIIYVPEAIGQRAAANIACKLARGKYVAKFDAHCSFDKGFDRKMLEGFVETGDDVVMVPIMRNLHGFDWVCTKPGCGWTKYQGPKPLKCEKCGRPHRIKRKIKWIGKHNPQSWSYCFDSQPHFQYFEEYKHRPGIKDKAKETGFSETMSLQGSCFFSTKKMYWELNLCDESLGNWGNQGLHVACAAWLSGHRVLVNHNTWYAHLFRTQQDFGFPYPQSGKAVQITKRNVKKHFWEAKHPKQIYPVSWLIKKFYPVKGWSDEDLNKLLEFESTLPNKGFKELGVLGIIPSVPGTMADHTPPMAADGRGQ